MIRENQQNEKVVPNVTYNLSEQELEKILYDVGFLSVDKLNLNSENNFVAYLAKK